MNLRHRVTTTDHSSHSIDRFNHVVNLGTVRGGIADAAFHRRNEK